MQASQAPVKHVGRRIVLGMAGVGAAGLLLGGNLNPLNWLDSMASNVGSVGDSGGLGFRIYTVNGIPAFDAATWSLRVDGMVSKPMDLSYSNFMDLPQTEQTSLFHCVTGWIVPNLKWKGVKLTDLFAKVQPKSNANFMTLYSMDGQYTDSISIGQGSKSDVMLAHSMNGAPLPAAQGLPVRLIIPEMYGYKNIKWVNRIEFTDHPISGYWEVRGYPVDAFIKKT